MLFLSQIEVGSHFYVNTLSGLHLHGETILVSLIVFSVIILFLGFGAFNMHIIPGSLQNVQEILYELLKSIALTQIGPRYYFYFLPFISTLFIFILSSNWAGALFPWKIFIIPNAELAAPTNDINTTACLALLTSFTYFFAGFKAKGIGYFKRYLQPTAFLLPINILEDFTKPLSLNFRLFGNVVADELTVSVLCSLVPIFVPIPIMVLGLFAGSIQALIFSTLAAAYIGEAVE